MYNSGDPLLNKYHVDRVTVAEIEDRDPDPNLDDVNGSEVGTKDNDDVVQPRLRDQFDMGVFRDGLATHMWARFEHRLW
ncbi:hypothetical protein PanWU01x14_328290 [Parasponia andersonii]|uniref:Uncharacterized protein n=1 Tax=Parasponia andersonii TaxID=3476 RepID=A0A2P5AIT5_PARAD|nr:hypothetical protein PanWU01x14_328290 [Parasponia andersonii]